MKRSWGYKGTQTAINGLTHWLINNIDLNGSASKKNLAAYEIIIEYATANIPGFKRYGHKQMCADFIAKKIDRNKKFHDFTSWVRKEYIIKLKQEQP